MQQQFVVTVIGPLGLTADGFTAPDTFQVTTSNKIVGKSYRLTYGANLQELISTPFTVPSYTATADVGNPVVITAQARALHPDSAIARVSGKFGNAVSLNGQLTFLETRFPGISGNSPRSVALWVKIDPDTPDTLAYAMLSWGSLATGGGRKWQLSWNTGSDNSGTLVPSGPRLRAVSISAPPIS